MPSAPRSLLLERVSDTALALEWTPPRFPNGALTEYLLQYRQGESGPGAGGGRGTMGQLGANPPLPPQ